MGKSFVLLGFFIIFSFTAASPAKGQTEASEAIDKTLAPYFFIKDGQPGTDRFPLKSTVVSVNINGVIADVAVTQQYANEGSRPLNARYIFPASTRAAVHGMTMTIGEEVIRAVVKKRDTAQQEFDSAVKKGKSASLLKQRRPNVFSMDVGNILPGDLIEVELKYSELLIPEDGTYAFVFPTVVGPRYSNQSESEATRNDRWVKNPYLPENTQNPTRFDIEVHLSAAVPIQLALCPSHQTDIEWESQSTGRVSLSPSEEDLGNRDFILNYRLAGRQIQSGLALYEGEEENFFLMMVEPPERLAAADIPPREYIFVVDISGSMHGFPLNTAKELLRNLIANLQPQDRFNVLLFAGGSRLMAPASLPATPDNIRQAIWLIDQQQGGGGTELYAALEKSLALPGDDAFSRTILVISDGYIALEKEVFQLVRENLNQANVFAFGIGSSVNRYLIEGLAKSGMGEPFVVTEPGNALDTAQRFLEYVSTPVLTQIEVEFDGFQTYDVEPVAIPDLFAARPVIVFGKWRGPREGEITLSGMGGDGLYRQTFSVSETTPLETNQGLSTLWARKRLARLSDFGTGPLNDETKAQIATLGLTYNLLTSETSFIAVHEAVRNHESPAEGVTQPLPLPLHVSNLAVGGRRVPEPELILLLVAAGLAVRIRIRFRSRVRIRETMP